MEQSQAKQLPWCLLGQPWQRTVSGEGAAGKKEKSHNSSAGYLSSLLSMYSHSLFVAHKLSAEEQEQSIKGSNRCLQQ